MLLCIMAIQNDDDRNTVERLYLENYKWMLYIARQILKDQNKAEDAVSQTFVKLIDKLQKFSFENCNKTRGLIGILVKDICYDMLKTEKSKRSISIDECDLPSDSDDPPFDQFLSEENYKIMLDSLSLLSEKANNILRLKYLYGYSDQEISEFLNISPENVRVRIHRAKAALLQVLKERSQNHE